MDKKKLLLANALDKYICMCICMDGGMDRGMDGVRFS